MEKTQIALVTLAILVAIGTVVSGTTITVCDTGCNTTNIQTGLDLAVDGETVFVHSGVYNESVVVYNSVNLVGEDMTSTILEGELACDDGGTFPEVIRVLADNVNIEGFTVRKGYMGISFYYSQGGTVTETNLSDNHLYGIYLRNTRDITLWNNIVSGSLVGFYSTQSSGNLIFNNLFDNEINAIDDSLSTWNVSKQPGPNIVGGPYLGGNYWSDSNGIDLNGDGLSDTEIPYTSTVNATEPDGGWALNTYLSSGGDYLPLVPPSLEGCSNLTVQADRHIVHSGSHPASEKYPITNLDVSVFNKTQILADGLSASWHNYKTIWTNYTPVSSGLTNPNGSVVFVLPAGNYMVIANYSAGSIFPGVSASDLACGQVMNKYLQVIEKSTGEKVPAKYTKKTGSELLIIEPEYIEWDSISELYPFVFDSVGDWNVTTVVYPPEGFVADHDNLYEEVLSEIEALQFNITDVGSEWIDTLVTHEIKHKGKKEKVHSKIGVKRKVSSGEKKEKPDKTEEKDPLGSLTPPSLNALEYASTTSTTFSTTTTTLENRTFNVEKKDSPGSEDGGKVDLKQFFEKLVNKIFERL
jgi:parallel beta-helix repeat protein